jgi:ABC-type enterobactin transport system permease subunit
MAKSKNNSPLVQWVIRAIVTVIVGLAGLVWGMTWKQTKSDTDINTTEIVQIKLILAGQAEFNRQQVLTNQRLETLIMALITEKKK